MPEYIKSIPHSLVENQIKSEDIDNPKEVSY